VIQTSATPPHYPEFDAVRVQKSKNDNGLWHLLFELQAKEHQSEFAKLCADMINAASGTTVEASTHDAMLQAYTDWLDFYKLSRKLTMESLRGLFGELIYLRDEIGRVPGMGPAVHAWVGPIGAPQDFVLPDFQAFEVKTIQPAGNSIKISSANQLDYDAPITLVVYRMAGSKDANTGENIHKVIADIEAQLDNPTVHVFRDKIAALGLDLDEEIAKETFFNYQSPMLYNASAADFPKIATSQLPLGVGNVKYEISVASLNNFLIQTQI
jgi:hypothetical protein